jgi:hypothetical protein
MRATTSKDKVVMSGPELRAPAALALDVGSDMHAPAAALVESPTCRLWQSGCG